MLTTICCFYMKWHHEVSEKYFEVFVQFTKWVCTSQLDYLKIYSYIEIKLECLITEIALNVLFCSYSCEPEQIHLNRGEHHILNDLFDVVIKLSKSTYNFRKLTVSVLSFKKPRMSLFSCTGFVLISYSLPTSLVIDYEAARCFRPLPFLDTTLCN